MGVTDGLAGRCLNALCSLSRIGENLPQASDTEHVNRPNGISGNKLALWVSGDRLPLGHRGRCARARIGLVLPSSWSC